MCKCLFLICPTDHLEPIIRNRFKGRHYFLTSLGNTMHFDKGTVGQVAALIEKKSINEITFVLSEDNEIVLDGLRKQQFKGIRGLNRAYKHLENSKIEVMNSWESHQQHAMILSYHLNKKIKELRRELNLIPAIQPNINGKLYSKAYNSFKSIYSELVCVNSNTLN